MRLFRTDPPTKEPAGSPAVARPAPPRPRTPTMTRSSSNAPGASWNDAVRAAASPAIRKAWRYWSRSEAAWHAARAAADATAERRARTRLDVCIGRLAAIPARHLDDVAPKVMVAAWLRCWDDDADLLSAFEAAIAAETTAINDRALPSDGADRVPGS